MKLIQVMFQKWDEVLEPDPKLHQMIKYAGDAMG